MKVHEDRMAALDRAEAEGEALFGELESLEAERSEQIRRAKREAWRRRDRTPSRAVRLAALHEAGHAVAGIALEREILGVAVYDDGTGWCLSRRTGEASTDPAHLAGAVMERLAGNGRARLSSADVALLQGNGAGVTLAGFEAEELLDANWSRVEALAERLIEQGFVSGSLARALVGQVRRP